MSTMRHGGYKMTSFGYHFFSYSRLQKRQKAETGTEMIPSYNCTWWMEYPYNIAPNIDRKMSSYTYSERLNFSCVDSKHRQVACALHFTQKGLTMLYLQYKVNVKLTVSTNTTLRKIHTTVRSSIPCAVCINTWNEHVIKKSRQSTLISETTERILIKSVIGGYTKHCRSKLWFLAGRQKYNFQYEKAPIKVNQFSHKTTPRAKKVKANTTKNTGRMRIWLG